MTHQPPVPEAAQSPYPLQPAAHNDGAKLVATPAPDPSVAIEPTVLAQLAGIGAAFVGSAALAAWYFRRGKKQAPAARKSGTRKTAAPKTAARTSAPRKAATTRATPRKSSDAALVAGGQPYEVSYFARKHGLSTDAVRDIFKEAGPSRAKANALAKERKG